MAVVRWDPWGDMAALQRDVSELLGQTMSAERARSAGSFERSFTLPEGTNPQDINASFEHGVLKLEIPHPPEAKPHRVQIAGGKGAEETVDVTESQRQRA
jgi:hypothetical protein